jgi:O-antigen ligase
MLLFAHTRHLVDLAVLATAVLADLWLISGTGALTPLFGLAAGLMLAVVAIIGRRAVGPDGRWPADGRLVSGFVGLVLLVAGAVAWFTRGTWLPWVGRTSDLTGRTAMWDVAFDWFGRRPIVGQGYLGAWSDPAFTAQMLAERGEVLGSTHNTFIEVLLGAGLIGAGLILALFALIWVHAGNRALVGVGWVAAWPLAALGFLIVENLAETLWVAGQLSVVLLGALAVVSTATASQPTTHTSDAEPRPTGTVGTDVVGVEERR